MSASSKRFFNDVVVICKRGEYKHKTVDIKPDPVMRLLHHVADIMHCARDEHRSLSAAEADCTVTRFIFNEFSLYTNNEPLSLNKFKHVIADVRAIAAQIPKNVHLVIGTMPVIWPDDTLHNVGLYVQCGSVPIIHFIEKNRPHTADPRYVKNDKKLRFFGETYVEAPHVESPYSSDRVLAGTAVSVNDTNQYRNAIKMNIDGVETLVITEICYEHALAMGMFFVNFLAKQLKTSGQSVPARASHLVLSDTISLVENHRLANITQADPENITPVRDCRKVVEINDPFFGGKTTLHFLFTRELGVLDREKIEGKDVYAMYGGTGMGSNSYVPSMDSFFDMLFNDTFFRHGVALSAASQRKEVKRGELLNVTYKVASA